MPYTALETKNCLVTGASGGIGSAIAHHLAAQKCNLFLTGTDTKRLEELKDDLVTAWGATIQVHCCPADLNRMQAMRHLITVVRKRFASVDVLINCAGIFIVKPLGASQLSDFETTLNVNLRAAFFFCREFSDDMKQKRWGRIVNIGSSSAYAGSPQTALYCASKHALLGFSRALQAELKAYNIRTFCISPAGTKTRMGRLINGQNYDTFIEPDEIAAQVVMACGMDGAAICDEIRLNRMQVQ